jgi:hypothetical protein
MLLSGNYLLESCTDNKIPNHKHQNTNKSQITIFNDQNIHPSCIASLLKSESAGNDAVGRNLS